MAKGAWQVLEDAGRPGELWRTFNISPEVCVCSANLFGIAIASAHSPVNVPTLAWEVCAAAMSLLVHRSRQDRGEWNCQGQTRSLQPQRLRNGRSALLNTQTRQPQVLITLHHPHLDDISKAELSGFPPRKVLEDLTSDFRCPVSALFTSIDTQVTEEYRGFRSLPKTSKDEITTGFRQNLPDPRKQTLFFEFSCVHSHKWEVWPWTYCV